MKTLLSPDLVKGLVPNTGGGYSHQISPEARLRRFLILGTDGGTYYQSEDSLNRENITNVLLCISELGLKRVRDIVVDILENNRALRVKPALLVLAIVAAHNKSLVFHGDILDRCIGIPTHLFNFLDFYKALGGSFSRMVRRAITRYYYREGIYHHMVKYQSRDGFSHRDVLRLAHVKPRDREMEAAFRWATHGMEGLEKTIVVNKNGATREHHPIEDLRVLPEIILEYEEIKKIDRFEDLPHDLSRYPWEFFNTKLLNDPRLWKKIQTPARAILRNVRRFAVMEDEELIDLMVKRISEIDPKKAKVHPMATLLPLLAVRSLDRRLEAALEGLIQRAFRVEEFKLDCNLHIAVDVSASMTWIDNSGIIPIWMAMGIAWVLQNLSRNTTVSAFSEKFDQINPGKIIQDKILPSFAFGATDCSLPMVKDEGATDVFVVITDNETNRNLIPPSKALKDYRMKFNKPNAALVVLALTATNFSIADPNDPLMLDIPGFTDNIAQIISELQKGFER